MRAPDTAEASLSTNATCVALSALPAPAVLTLAAATGCIDAPIIGLGRLTASVAVYSMSPPATSSTLNEYFTYSSSSLE